VNYGLAKYADSSAETKTACDSNIILFYIHCILRGSQINAKPALRFKETTLF